MGSTDSATDRRRPQSSTERLTYSIDDVAALLGISRSTAYECARRGELPVRRFGRRVLVMRHELEALLSEQTHPFDDVPNL